MESLRSALALVAGLIQATRWMRAARAVFRLPTRASISALACGVKYWATYIRPTASPSEPLTKPTPRFQRGWISGWPARVLLRKPKRAWTKRSDRKGEAESTTWNACQAFSESSGVAAKIAATLGKAVLAP